MMAVFFDYVEASCCSIVEIRLRHVLILKIRIEIRLMAVRQDNSVNNIRILTSYLTQFYKIYLFLAHLDVSIQIEKTASYIK